MRTVGIEIMSNTRKILIVDDDFELRDALTSQACLKGFQEYVALKPHNHGLWSAATPEARSPPAQNGLILEACKTKGNFSDTAAARLAAPNFD